MTVFVLSQVTLEEAERLLKKAERAERSHHSKCNVMPCQRCTEYGQRVVVAHLRLDAVKSQRPDRHIFQFGARDRRRERGES